ncbi:MAG: bifunctional oligoribonuclease/PAP phosphatase NrnA [Planctomycetes bacterium]|nr:bifunctional oligoribonuclease/PAP phosphatase NrnA [Planctomycetota bacterium]
MPQSHPQQYDQAAALLQSARRVVIGGHPIMDGDALGCTLALASTLRAAGREVLTVTQDLQAGKYTFLEGADQLVPLNSLPLVLTGFDACIVVDCGAESRARALLQRLAPGTPVINLDHHVDNPGFGDAAVVMPKASSSGEVVYNTLRRAGLELTKGAAEALFCAIVTDTGRFMFNNSTPESYRIVAQLVEQHGLQVGDLTRQIYRNKSVQRLKLEAMVGQTLQTRMDGKVAIARVTLEMLNQTGSSDAEANELVTFPGALAGVMVSLLFRELGPQELKVSFRSEGQMPVNDLAAKFHGGGHLRAAGAHIKGRAVAEVEAEIIAALEAQLAATLASTGGAIIC